MRSALPWPVRLFALMLGVAPMATFAAGTTATAAPAPLRVRVMSFNLRYASPRPPQAWPDRRPVVCQLLEKTAPDVIATQEGLYAQLRDIAADSPAYDWIGLGREGGSRGEFMAVFYRKERLEPVAFDHFWLSATPDRIGSITWGHKYQRMVTWVRFRERATGREFYVWNTHFDHEVEQARQQAAALLRERIGALDPAVPLLLAGDFNCAAGASRPFMLLTGKDGLTDTWNAAATRVNETLSTFHNYEPARHDGERIDWILARGLVAVDRAEIVDFHAGRQFPSDHFPVMADVRF